ncbi:group II intron reverse transcriptase/maturase, partial [Klebsiella pneumoniae]
IKKGDNFIRVRHHTSLVVNPPITSILIKLNKHPYSSHPILPKPTPLPTLIHQQIKTILIHYLPLPTPIINYYTLPTNFTTLTPTITYILFYSSSLTLPTKFKLNTLNKLILKFPKLLLHPHSKLTFTIHHFKITHKINITHSNYTPHQILHTYKYILPTSLSLFTPISQISPSKHHLQLHHLTTLNNPPNKIKHHYLLPTIININTKQITISKTSHFKLHQPKYNPPPL